MAEDSKTLQVLSDALSGNLEKPTALQSKQARLLELLKNGAKIALPDVSTDLPPESSSVSGYNEEGLEEAVAWQKHRQRQRGPRTGSSD